MAEMRSDGGQPIRRQTLNTKIQNRKANPKQTCIQQRYERAKQK